MMRWAPMDNSNMNMDLDHLLTEEEKIDRGMQAAALLEHPLLKDALSDIADMCLRHFAAADPNDHEALMAARRMLQTADEFKNVFRRIVTVGRSAASKAEHTPQEVL
jgi:hypothetical protein